MQATTLYASLCRRLKSLAKPVYRRLFNQYSLGLIAIALLSFGLRFWQISRFDDLVFDETYFVKFARAYLVGTPQFDAHPPLGKYFIAAGIWLGDRASITTPLSYRWMNALIGGGIPLIVMKIAYALSPSSNRRPLQPKAWTFGLLAGTFVAIDGLFVTESRYGLINIYMVFFGLLGHWLWLRASLFLGQRQAFKRMLYQGLAGVALGAAIGTKWNGLGYVLSLLIWEVLVAKPWQGQIRFNIKAFVRSFFYLILIPSFTYCLIWQPHLYLTQESLGSTHIALLNFHQRLAAGHPACSQWFTWPLLIKPIAYWYEKSGSVAYTVNNLGNPALWWLSSAAVFLLCLEKVSRLAVAIRVRWSSWGTASLNTNSLNTNRISDYLLISYAANWLPWLLVERCTFIYLYMPAAVFSFMAIAWLLSEWLCSSASSPQARTIALAMLGAIALAFFFWLPLMLGSPLTPDQLQARWWLKTWL
ncbi:MAG: phospholipid carrier-dependent glycosyltransferase [Phormidesmis sp.]